MKYKLTTSIFAKCRLLTLKVNFVVTIAYCYALRATYFITQRAEAPKGATQRKSNFCKAFARRGGIKKILVADIVNAIVSHIKSLRETKKIQQETKNRKTIKPQHI